MPISMHLINVQTFGRSIIILWTSIIFHMTDYSQLRDFWQNDSNISKAVIDEFLLYYTARRDNLDREFETRIYRFRDIVAEMRSKSKRLIKAPCIGHRIFKDGE